MDTIVKIQEPGLCYTVRVMKSGKHDAWLIMSPTPETLALLAALPDFEGKEHLVAMVKDGKFSMQIYAHSY